MNLPNIAGRLLDFQDLFKLYGFLEFCGIPRFVECQEFHDGTGAAHFVFFPVAWLFYFAKFARACSTLFKHAQFQLDLCHLAACSGHLHAWVLLFSGNCCLPLVSTAGLRPTGQARYLISDGGSGGRQA